MAQYQSFPGAAGDSRTLDKLKALSLPSLAGRRFLDVGCNEGFFCGFASHAGAARVVGLDASAGFIERARARFPRCEFIARSWDELPEGPFDVVLLASALHYAEDQPTLIHSLASRLSLDGVLVLEIGVSPSPRSEWVTVKRGIDERVFPTMPKLREILQGYAWKWMGPSIPQDGDPVKRHVFHVSRRRPMAYLLMQPPGYGKTSISSSLFGPSGVPVVSGDDVVARLAAGKQAGSADLVAAVAEDFSPFRLDEIIRKAFDAGQGADLVQACIARAGEGDFALDMYVPIERHAMVEQLLVDAGYLPVLLRWQRPVSAPAPADESAALADAFYLSLVNPEEHPPASETAAPWQPAGCGFLDELSFVDQRLVLRGWAVDRDGKMPGRIDVRVGDRTYESDNFERQIRQDVQRALGLPHALLGYRIVLDVADVGAGTLARTLRLQIPGGATFGISAPLEDLLAGSR